MDANGETGWRQAEGRVASSGGVDCWRVMIHGGLSAGDGRQANKTVHMVSLASGHPPDKAENWALKTILVLGQGLMTT